MASWLLPILVAIVVAIFVLLHHRKQSPSSPDAMFLVRVLEGSPSKWDEGQATSIASFAFGSPPISVFEVAPGQHEAQAIAAQYQTKSKNHLKMTYVVRIDRARCEQLGIAVNPSPGETGIAAIDQTHHELAADPAQFAKLAASLIDDYLSGDDLIRRLEAPQLKYQLNAFVALSAGISPQALKRCRTALGI